jgi:hypothetical protein
VKIPLVLALWEDVGFRGQKRTLVENMPGLLFAEFSDRASSVGVHPGPDYEAFKRDHGGQEPTVGLFPRADYHGKPLILQRGVYPDLRVFDLSPLPGNFSDVVNSVQFLRPGEPQVPSGDAAPIRSIPLVVYLYLDIKQESTRICLVQSSTNLGAEFGFDDKTSSVEVKEGPNYTGTEKGFLCRDHDFLGGGIILEVGRIDDLREMHFNDEASSLRIDGSV